MFYEHENEWAHLLKTKRSSFEKRMTTEIKIEAETLKIINGNLYIYSYGDSIKVYDTKTFKLKADLGLPFKNDQRLIDILDNEVLIYLIPKKLYFYKINLAENKLEYKFYLPNIYAFHYLSKRKEIFLLTESRFKKKGKQFGVAKADLMGNIILSKKIDHRIKCDFFYPGEIKKYGLPNYKRKKIEMFSVFNGLLDDKYIINITGTLNDWYNYKYDYGQTDVESEINIFKADDLTEILNEKHDKYLNYKKIGDNLFKFRECEVFFFYNEKENKIEYINNMFNYLNNITDDKLNQEYEHSLSEGFEYSIPQNLYSERQDYFYLSDKLFALFDSFNSSLYIVDISNQNKVVRKIEAFCNTKNYSYYSKLDNYFIKDILYYKNGDKRENLFIYLRKEKEQNKEEGKIVYGIIKNKKDE